MIREMRSNEIPVCVDIIRKSFQTVADEFGFTEENAPYFTAFAMTEEKIQYWAGVEHRMLYVWEDEGVLCGFYCLLFKDDSCEIGSLSVLPEYRHKGIGRKFLEHACEVARSKGFSKIDLSIVEENKVLRNWYEQNGAVHLGTKKFDFFPFTCGYMEIKL